MIYSSTDVARETGMTTEGLRFYEKNGIIKVRKNESNGYRAYEIMQVPLLRMARFSTPMACRSRRWAGFSIRTTAIWGSSTPPGGQAEEAARGALVEGPRA